jgi:O-antigen/teichoic acid export membrane protein
MATFYHTTMETAINEAEVQQIKKKTFSGVLALTSRTFILQVISFVSTFLLTIFLTPETFGIFYVVTAVISFLNYFSDIGLAAALIQKKEEISQEDLVTTFTIQQILVGILTVAAFVFSSWIANFYRLDQSGLWLLRMLVVSFFLSSLKTIPSILLERSLEFKKLIIPQVLETAGFYGVAVTLAWKGYGVSSFTWAVGVRAVVGLVAMYIVSPWRVSLGIRTTVARRLLRFGIPFQMNAFLALLKDDLMTVFLGRMLPLAELGYIGWAKKWADAPLRLIMDSIIRVTFPAFSRLQSAREQLARGIEKTLFGMSLAILPVTVGLLFFIDPLIHLVPRYAKWEPAVMSFYFLALASAVASLSTPLTSALNAVGRIKVTLGLMVLWTTATWILTIALVTWYGFNGFAIALFLVTLTIGIVIRLVRRVTPFSFWRSVSTAVYASVVLALYYYLLLSVVPHTFVVLGLVGLSGGILYGWLVWLVDKARLMSIVAGFRR